jgi:hypothetical protein
MVAPYTLILTPNGSKKAWPPRKIPQNDEHIIICTTNSLKNKKRRIRRRSIVPMRRIRRGKKIRIRRDE